MSAKISKLAMESLEQRLAMDCSMGFASWNNFQHPTDVNCDDVTTATDALLIINSLAVNELRELDPESFEGLFRLDVNNDQALSPADAIAVINRLHDRAELRAELQSAEALWAEKGSDSYGLEFQYVCECSGRHTLNRVVNDVVVESTDLYRQEPIESTVTVLGMFDEIRNAIDSDYAEIRVTFDSQDGHISSLYFDPFAGLVDEEYGIEFELTFPF